MSLDLPAPPAEALVISDQLSARIADRIRRDGPLRLSQFWDLALYAPGLGYYTAGSMKFGAEGDFITAPELGPMFAGCLAHWIAEQPRFETLIELGAGTGRLAVDLLKALDERDRLPDRYLILDRSADLKQRQQQILADQCPDLLHRVDWVDQVPQSAWSGLMLGNEVVDAVAAERVLRTGDGWDTLCIDLINDELNWTTQRIEAIDRHMRRIEATLTEALPTGYVTECQPSLPAWMAALTRTQCSGAMLWIDYGYARHEYYHPQRDDGTLIAHYRHRAHDDVLRWPGLQDLSVSVDFDALGDAVIAAGWQVTQVSSQAAFLLDNGLIDQLDPALPLDCAEAIAQRRELKMLTMPSEMGERFKVLCAERQPVSDPC